MTPEEEARQEIDRLLVAGSWQVQDYKDLNLGAALGVAIREFPLESGRADYLLFVDRVAVGAIEAKPVGTILVDVEGQTERYLRGIPDNIPHVQNPLPFEYESTGTETHFADLRDPDWRSRRVFAFHRPETLKSWISSDDTLRGKLRKLPELQMGGLWQCQFEAITNLDKSLADNRPRAFLHGIGGEESPIEVGDSLISDPGYRSDIVLTNPPFGKKSSVTIVNGDGKGEREALSYNRQDFWATTSNKQLNFLQHVRTLLKINGRAAIVVPDNVLFEGGAGETVRRKLLQDCDVHTLLRLPTGVFYAQGVKANVLFFDRKPASQNPWTEKLWIYDLRTNQHFTLKTNPLKFEDLQDFIKCYNPDSRHQRQETDRFKAFTYEELMQRDKANLDIFWLKDESLEDSDNLPEPEVLAAEIVENLEAALEQFKSIYEGLGKDQTLC